jgi:hypothetical protein
MSERLLRATTMGLCVGSADTWSRATQPLLEEHLHASAILAAAQHDADVSNADKVLAHTQSLESACQAWGCVVIPSCFTSYLRSLYQVDGGGAYRQGNVHTRYSSRACL